MGDKDRLNNESPTFYQAAFGTKLDQIITSLNALIAGVQGGNHIRMNVTFTNSTTALSIGAFAYVILGVPAWKAASTVTPTTTTHNVAQNKWASFRVSIQSGGTITLTKAADVDTQAAAIANLAAVPTGEADLGYFVVRGGTGAGYVAGTTNLQTGAIAGMVVNYFPKKAALAPVDTLAV